MNAVCRPTTPRAITLWSGPPCSTRCRFHPATYTASGAMRRRRRPQQTTLTHSGAPSEAILSPGNLPPEGFDLILLGMGDNGHTASLFPGLAAVTETVRWVMAHYVEVVGMWRVTMTPVIINAARQVAFLVSGAKKAEMLQRVLEGPYQPVVLPSQIIKPVSGELHWLLDQPAAARLRRES